MNTRRSITPSPCCANAVGGSIWPRRKTLAMPLAWRATRQRKTRCADCRRRRRHGERSRERSGRFDHRARRPAERHGECLGEGDGSAARRSGDGCAAAGRRRDTRDRRGRDARPHARAARFRFVERRRAGRRDHAQCRATTRDETTAGRADVLAGWDSNGLELSRQARDDYHGRTSAFAAT